jgi:hypothetical protein
MVAVSWQWNRMKGGKDAALYQKQMIASGWIAMALYPKRHFTGVR